LSYKPEILAPVGNFICLRAAIQGGCDAVYLGFSELNMRASAKNFVLDDVDEIVEICSEAGVKVYLTLNTIIYDRELEVAERIIRRIAGKFSAVICWDLSIIELCRSYGVSFHISTQASIANRVSAKFYGNLGAERIVLARECSLDDIVSIKRGSGLEVEVFVHGAMCVSYSGRCFLSQFSYGKSANRGECYQNCRREYEISDFTSDNEFMLGNNYVMSAKDLCTMPFLERLLEAGIDSFKIEGRNRTPEYVRTVVGAYRRAIDAWLVGKFDDVLKDELMAELRTVYNRNFSSGFYLGKPINEFTKTGGSEAVYKKLHVGYVSNYFKKVGVVEVTVLDNCFGVGDTIFIQGNTTGTVSILIDDVWQDGKAVDRIERGLVTFKSEEVVRRNDKVFCRVLN